MLSLQVTANEDTGMLCDANNCGTADDPILFGEPVPNPELRGLELSNLIFLDEVSTGFIDIQASVITTLATEIFIESIILVDSDLSAYTAEGLLNIQRSITKTLSLMFGITSDANANLFMLTLPNLNDEEESMNAVGYDATWSVVNAATGNNINESVQKAVDIIIDAVVAISNTPPSDPNYDEVASNWESNQQFVMNAAVELLNSGNLSLPEESMEFTDAIIDAANNGVDIEAIAAAIEETTAIIGNNGETGGTGGTGG
ncbi:hypothetical protein [Thalassotalea agarivorans]|uniref:Uncharacterized protein n=1 Tax=Thalassotalea agarivorans TaxID=349064 RepID=A0A1H9Y2M5_THASX|nr:hypothetical protein [Thalassotalea agarivorans]SES62574.1 hypothetical protein SAMN05660429_00026 [Thalassotalea agarivorans]